MQYLWLTHFSYGKDEGGLPDARNEQAEVRDRLLLQPDPGGCAGPGEHRDRDHVVRGGQQRALRDLPRQYQGLRLSHRGALDNGTNGT